MANSVGSTSVRIVVLYLVLLVPVTSFAQLYGVPVSGVGNNIDVLSPDREWSVSIKANRENLPTLTIRKVSGGRSEELIGVLRSGWVLWSPESRAFAFTDAAFADHYLLHLCSIESTATQCRDDSPELERRVKKTLPANAEIDRLYLKALRWQSPSMLVVGVHAVISEVKPGQTRVPVHYLFSAFSVSAKTGRIIKELTKKRARFELGESLDQLEW